MYINGVQAGIEKMSRCHLNGLSRGVRRYMYNSSMSWEGGETFANIVIHIRLNNGIAIGFPNLNLPT